MTDSDLMQLYSQQILKLAANIPHLGKLDAPSGTAARRSPQCGSTVSVDVRLADGRIADFAQEVRACALGQASAAVLGGAVIGRNRDDIERDRAALVAMLKDGAPAPDGPFADLKALTPARDFPNRHASILLAWDATLAAIDAAQS